MANKRSLTSEEEAIFNAEWSPLWTRHLRSREVMDIFEDHRDAILEAAEIAASGLESEFGGVNAATNQFGWQPILPNHLLTGPTDSAWAYSKGTWETDIATTDVTTGWMDWIGTNSSMFKLSKYSTMIIIGFADPVETPKVDAILAKIKSTDYPIWNFADLVSETDYHVVELVTPFVVEHEQDFYLQKFCGRAGRDSLRPLGVMFSKGDYMRDKNAYAKV